MNATRTGSESRVEPAPCPEPAAPASSAPVSGTTVFVSGTGEPAAKPCRRSLLLKLGAVPVLLAIAYGAAAWWDHSRTWTKTDNVYVAAHVHTISPRVAGTVQQVFVDDHQPVQAGTVLARLDPADFQIRVTQAEAQVSQAEAQKRQAEARLAEARAQSAREAARAAKARLDFQRAQALFSGTSGAISKQEYDQAQAEHEAAQAAADAAASAIASAQSLIGAADAQIKVATAGLQDAKLQLSYTELTAPAAGRIGRKNLETGNRVQPGQSLLALVQEDVWLTANFKETQLARMKPGQTVRVRLDAFPGQQFTGKVESLSPASGAQFALLPPDNATGNFTRIVQRVPVKILFDHASLNGYAGRIVAGMSAVVEVNVRE